MNQREVSLEGPNKRVMIRRPSTLFNLWMDDFLEDFIPSHFQHSSYIVPRIDVMDKGDRYELHAELPGLDKKEIEVEIHENTVLVKGEKKISQEQNEEKYCHREMAYGKMMREITVPEKIDQEKAKASYENGILKLILPKTDTVKSRKIELI